MPEYNNQKLKDRMENDFRYHPPVGDQLERYPIIRSSARQLAEIVAKYTPESREQSLAITKIEEAVFWANAAIARNEVTPLPQKYPPEVLREPYVRNEK